ncbi:hypothetical protein BDV96DRAFT_651106 [Lophiotrema nucula]|uniref:Uncharacterized protein n=1 Tax=Lophiotrema nucula TaxID=690887 RepID=A0A6A5YTX0_9PLEO|nr:hypothetical protein BDV96DRAFT_651106 [Lophiotrema nucula]
MARRSSDLPVFHPPQPTPAPSPPASVKSFRTDSTCVSIDGYDESKNTNSPSSRASSFSGNPRQASNREYMFDWTLKVLGILSTVLFGIWAPVSYKAQTSGNASNDDAQAYLNTQIDNLNDRVQELGEELIGLKKIAEFEARLKAWQFCEQKGKRELSACRSVLEKYEINSIIADLAENSKHRLSSRSATTPAASTFTSAESLSRKTEIPAPRSTSTMPLDYVASSGVSQSSHGMGPVNTTPALPVSGGAFGEGVFEGEAFRMAAGVGFIFGVVVIMGVIGGWRVARGKKTEGWEKMRVR